MEGETEAPPLVLVIIGRQQPPQILTQNNQSRETSRTPEGFAREKRSMVCSAKSPASESMASTVQTGPGPSRTLQDPPGPFRILGVSTLKQDNGADFGSCVSDLWIRRIKAFCLFGVDKCPETRTGSNFGLDFKNTSRMKSEYYDSEVRFLQEKSKIFVLVLPYFSKDLFY